MKHIGWYFALVLGLYCIAPGGSPAIFAAGPKPLPQDSSASTSIPRSVRVVLDLVDESGGVIVYDNFSRNASARRGQFPGAIFSDQAADHRFILFDDVKSIQDLSNSLRAVLLSNLTTGRWIIGIKGTDSDLKSALGLLPPELDGIATPYFGKAAFLYRNPAGILNELIVDAPTEKNLRSGGPNGLNALSTAFGFLTDWYKRKKLLVADGDDPWNALQNFEWDGTTKGNYNGNTQTIGTYKFTLSPYYMDSDQNGKDWYRVDFQTISEITNYEYTGHEFGDTSGKCGWWTDAIHAQTTVLTPGGEWWEFMPDTTVGSTSKSFSIGGDISDTAGLSGSYSKSYGTPDVTIQVEANSVDQSISWVASLSGCGDYSMYPFYHGASDAAKTTYNLNPSYIIDVPSGATMSISTSADPEGAWLIETQKDHIKCDIDCSEIHTHRYKADTMTALAISCTKTACVIGNS